MLRPWELNVDISRESGTSIHSQIAQKIIEEIKNGRFTPGVALPGTREFASKIKVNRKTVIQAYDELIAQGWLISESKRGTFVSSRFLAINNKLDNVLQSKLIPAPVLPSTGRPTLNKKQLHDFIHFSDGLPDVRLMPFEMHARAMRHALITTARNAKCVPSDYKGAMILREAIAHMLNMERGLHAKPENVCVVRSSQMGIFVVAKAFLALGDNIVVEELGCPIVRDTFSSCGANILTVTQDAEGMNLDHLAQLCEQKKIAAVYVTPHHQIPTAVTMPKSRRAKLLALAEAYDFLIIENDTDHAFNFAHRVALPIASMQKSKRVIYIGSMAKVLTSGLNIGYIVAPESVVSACASQIMLIDSEGNQTVELAVAELMHTGEIKKHISRTQKIYAARRLFLAQLLQEELGQYLSFELSESGLAFWLSIDTKVNMKALESCAEIYKVRFQSGRFFSSFNRHVNSIRIGFASLDNEEAIQGVARLKRAFAAVL